MFGSDNLSLHALPIAQLKIQAKIVMSPLDAKKGGYVAGQLLYCDDNSTALQLIISTQVPASCLLIYVPADQLFELQHCEQLTAATGKQIDEYSQQIKHLQTTQQTVKQQHRDKLLAQDQTIPIHFIDGVI